MSAVRERQRVVDRSRDRFIADLDALAERDIEAATDEALAMFGAMVLRLSGGQDVAVLCDDPTCDDGGHS